LIPIRRFFEQYASIRPLKLMPGIQSPLRNREYGDIDFIVVRENNEGEYSSVGGRMFDGTDFEFATQPFGPWSRVHRNDRHRSIGEFESGTRFPFDVRAGARIGAGYCRRRRTAR
jgi:hypothetical protein